MTEQHIEGAAELADLWRQLRRCTADAERRSLINLAVCAAARLEREVHAARSTAARLVRARGPVDTDTRRLAESWARLYLDG